MKSNQLTIVKSVMVLSNELLLSLIEFIVWKCQLVVFGIFQLKEVCEIFLKKTMFFL